MNEKLWDYANTTMYDLLHTEEQVDVFLNAVTKFDEEEKILLREYIMQIKFSKEPVENNTEVMVDPKEEEEEVRHVLNSFVTNTGKKYKKVKVED